MFASSAQPPCLVVEDGPIRGVCFEIPTGRSLIGRHNDAMILLDDEFVSGRHAAVERAGDRVAITDLGSRNGTWINGRRLDHAAVLRDRDVVRVGAVSLRFSAGSPDTASAMAAPATPSDRRRHRDVRYDFGDVSGSVQTGDGQQYVAGRDQYVAGRDQYHDNSVRLDADYDPWDELFSGKGIGRVLMAIGGCVALAGFATWMYCLFSVVGADPGDFATPFDRELIPGVPLAVAGFAAFGGGGVLAAVGAGLSKAARKREERRRRYRR